MFRFLNFDTCWIWKARHLFCSSITINYWSWPFAAEKHTWSTKCNMLSWALWLKLPVSVYMYQKIDPSEVFINHVTRTCTTVQACMEHRCYLFPLWNECIFLFWPTAIILSIELFVMLTFVYTFICFLKDDSRVSSRLVHDNHNQMKTTVSNSCPFNGGIYIYIYIYICWKVKLSCTLCRNF